MLDGVVPPLLITVAGLTLLAGRQLYVTRHGRRGFLGDVAIATAVVSLAIILEFTMGRSPTYQHGPVRLWSGDIRSDQNSQQIFDPYSFTHVVHGAAFYGLTRLALRSAPIGLAAVVVVTLEAAWEVYENTDQVVNRYRAATISLGYYGDSVINSVADILACMAGFLLAWRRPALVTVGLGCRDRARSGSLHPRQSHPQPRDVDPPDPSHQGLADGAVRQHIGCLGARRRARQAPGGLIDFQDFSADPAGHPRGRALR